MFRLIAWVKRKRTRKIIVSSFLTVIAIYLIVGSTIALTSSDWRRSDTYSMITGVVSFVFGTVLAVLLEERQDDAREILAVVRTGVETTVSRLTGLKHLSATGTERVNEEAHVVQGPEPHAAAEGPSESSTEEVPEVEPIDPHELVLTLLSDEENTQERKEILQRFALERAIQVRAEFLPIRELFRSCDGIFALGFPVGDTTVEGGSAESDILHFTADMEPDREQTFMPVFTRFEVLKAALVRNPEWQTLSILAIRGGDLFANTDPDVTIVINPWARGLEFHLAP